MSHEVSCHKNRNKTRKLKQLGKIKGVRWSYYKK